MQKNTKLKQCVFIFVLLVSVKINYNTLILGMSHGLEENLRMINKEVFGLRVYESRRKKGFTQEKLAELLDCSSVYISQIERGLKLPSLDFAHDIAITLDVTVDELICVNSSYIPAAAINNRGFTREEKETLRQINMLLVSLF